MDVGNADFDEMRLVHKRPEGFVWRCPCGLGSRRAARSAGKARRGARDHILRRHRNQPTPTARTTKYHASGLPGRDAVRILDAAKRLFLQVELLRSRDFQERIRSGIEGRYGKQTYHRLVHHYAFVQQVLRVKATSEVPVRAWLPLVETLRRLGYCTVYDVPDWSVPGPKAVLIGITALPKVRCQAYVAPKGRQRGEQPGRFRPCPNWADRLVVLETGRARRRVRTALCRIHRKSHGRGYDLSEGGGEGLVDFSGATRPQAGGVRPAAPRPPVTQVLDLAKGAASRSTGDDATGDTSGRS